MPAACRLCCSTLKWGFPLLDLGSKLWASALCSHHSIPRGGDAHPTLLVCH